MFRPVNLPRSRWGLVLTPRKSTAHGAWTGISGKRSVKGAPRRLQSITGVDVEKIDPLRVHVILPRTVFGQIKLGMTGTVAPEAPMGNQVTGVVTVLDSVVDGASGTFSAYLDLPKPKHRIPAGIRCQASFAAAAQGSAN